MTSPAIAAIAPRNMEFLLAALLLVSAAADSVSVAVSELELELDVVA